MENAWSTEERGYFFLGIHNAWNNVPYIAIELSQPENKRQGQ